MNRGVMLFIIRFFLWNNTTSKDIAGRAEKLLSEYEMEIRADERKKILGILYRLVKSDYNSKECKLLISDLQEFLEE